MMINDLNSTYLMMNIKYGIEFTQTRERPKLKLL